MVNFILHWDKADRKYWREMEVSSLALNTDIKARIFLLVDSTKKKSNVSERARHISTELFAIISYKLVLTNFASWIKLFISSRSAPGRPFCSSNNDKPQSYLFFFEKAALLTSGASLVGELILTITHPLTSSRPSRHSRSSSSSWILSFWKVSSILRESWTRGEF